jgi:hypothetical protein
MRQWEWGGRVGARWYRAGVVGLAAVLMGVGGAACAEEEAPQGTRQVDEFSEVGDCLGPDPERSGSYTQCDCDDPEATGEIIEMVTDVGPSAPPLCPPRTDELVDAEQGPVVDGDVASLPQTWCLRNLDPPHPGDPGAGGGELLEQDCFTVAESGAIQEVACDGSGPAPPQHRLVGISETVDGCPPVTAEPVELASVPPQVLCAGPV